jgi:integrase
MARTPQFTPVETPQGWMVSIPQAMTATGKRRRKYFAGKTAAEKFAASLRQQHGAGLRGAMIPLSLAHQAAEAQRILEGSGISLVEAARLAVARIATTASRETFRDRYARAMLWGEEHWSGRYRLDMERVPRWVPSLLPLACGAIDRARIETALQESGPLARSTIDTRARYVSAVIGFRERHRKSPTIHVLTADQQQAVLAACGTADERRVVALLLYAGIRPDAESGEISRLLWQNVGKAEIYVPQSASKTGADRLVPIRPVLRRLLMGHPASGPVAPAGWRRAWQRIRKAAGIASMQDVLRHTFASHYLAAFGEDAAKQALGHAAGSTTLFRHYRRAVTEQQGKAFFR